MRVTLYQVPLLSLVTVRSINIDSSVGQHLSLSCPSPSSPPSCGPRCTWRGPHNISVSSDQSLANQFHVSFNQSHCKCFLFIQNTSLDHSGLWTCQLKEENNKQKRKNSQTSTTALDLKNRPSLDGLYININKNKEIRERKLMFYAADDFLNIKRFLCF